MAFEEYKAEISLLFQQMEHQPEDRHELYMQVREKLNEMRAFGMPVPEDFKKLLDELDSEFQSELSPPQKN